jgi:type IV pilus assembly protein PilE
MSQMPCATPNHVVRGFTLIELLVTVAIVAILGALAYPSYMESIYKGRRADAVDGMTRIQQAQERWRANNSTYSASLANLNVAASSPTGYYQLAVAVPNGFEGSQYTITATAVGAQVKDTKCASMTMSMAGGQLTYDSTSGQRCWSK